MSRNKRYLALCGGVGGAKLVLGLSRVLESSQLTVVVNTGDDFEHLGLLICPDLDTVTYTLAGLVHPEQGWGRAGESWNALAEVERLGGESWFRLGDRDIGLHLVRRTLLEQGMALSEATAYITGQLGIGPAIVPMSDAEIRTEVETDQGCLAFQHYFVRERCEPAVRGIRFAGARAAKPSSGFLQALRDPGLAGVIICPSNPFLSIDPILSLPGVRTALSELDAPVVAVSPLVAGQAIKGPTAKIMQELRLPVSVAAIAGHYTGLLDGLIVDHRDRVAAAEIEPCLPLHHCETIMTDLASKIGLAEQAVGFLTTLAGGS